MVHRDDAERLGGALTCATTSNRTAAVEVRVRMPDRSWSRVLITITSLTDRSALGAAATSSRVAVLEAHLLRIADEVEAAGLMRTNVPVLDVTRLAELSMLTAKQWDILERLLRGERVPSIARSVFLAPSTVRNHLSAIYKTLGVHSQAELIEKIRVAMDPNP